MADSYPCPHCGETLEVPPEMRLTPVRCASCQKVFTPGASNDVADDPPRLSRQARVNDDFIAPRHNSRRRLWIILALVLGLGGLVCCGGGGYIAYMLMNPEWETFESATEGFTAKFPGKVSESKRATGRTGDAPANAFEAEREMLQERFEIQCIPLSKADLKKKPDALLNELADAAMSLRATGKSEKPRVQRTQEGREAMEFAMKLKGGMHFQCRIILAEAKAYVLTVDGPGDPDGSPWVEEFFDSFTVTQNAKK